jgi:sarcosine oxidase
VRGRRVLGIEQFQQTHSRGSSHGRSRVIRQAYYEDPRYVPLLQRSYELWRDLLLHQQKHSVDLRAAEPLLQIVGGLFLGSLDSKVVQGVLDSAKTHGLPHKLLSANDIRRDFPCFAV